MEKRNSDFEDERYSNIKEPILEKEQPSHEKSTRLKNQPKEVK